jgi:hypothetical protein
MPGAKNDRLRCVWRPILGPKSGPKNAAIFIPIDLGIRVGKLINNFGKLCVNEDNMDKWGYLSPAIGINKTAQNALWNKGF